MALSAAEVRAARFQATRLREGYDQEQVDAFLERIALTLDAVAAGEPPAMTGDEVLNARFRATKFGPGYDQDEVDDFLDRVVRTLRGVDGSRAPAQPISGAALRDALTALEPARLRPGYDPVEVTAFLTSAAHALDLHARGLRPSPTADDVLARRFPATFWRPGLDQGAVDGLLDRVVATLRG